MYIPSTKGDLLCTETVTGFNFTIDSQPPNVSQIENRLKFSRPISLMLLATNHELKLDDSKDNIVIFGVVTGRSQTVINDKKGRPYRRWEISDLQQAAATVLVYQDVSEKAFVGMGQLVGLCDCDLLPITIAGAKKRTLVIKYPSEQVLRLGFVQEYDTCKFATETGVLCNVAINKALSKFCPCHQQRAEQLCAEAKKRNQLRLSVEGIFALDDGTVLRRPTSLTLKENKIIVTREKTVPSEIETGVGVVGESLRAEAKSKAIEFQEKLDATRRRSLLSIEESQATKGDEILNNCLSILKTYAEAKDKLPHGKRLIAVLRTVPNTLNVKNDKLKDQVITIVNSLSGVSSSDVAAALFVFKRKLGINKKRPLTQINLPSSKRGRLNDIAGSV